MAQIFIAYKRDDIDTNRAATVRKALEALGVSVFIDREIGQRANHAQDYQHVIEQELATVDAVLVLWTEASCKSVYVRAEATKGLDREVLVTAMFGDIARNLPSPF